MNDQTLQPIVPSRPSRREVRLASPAAQALHHDCVVVDLHADTLELVRWGYDLALEHRSFAWTTHTFGHIDLARLRHGGVSAVVFGVVMFPWKTRKSAPRKIACQCDLLEGCCQSLSQDLVRAYSSQDILEARQAGKIAALVGVEGSHGLSRNGSALDLIAQLGVRYVGPAHLFHSAAAPSNFWSPNAPHNARTEAFVAELRQRRLLIDLAHLPRPPFLEICRTAQEPVIVSHTGLAAVHPLWRNIDDEQIRAVADTGGVVGVILAPRYLGRRGIDGVVAHLEHLIAVGGEDVAALGSDFDGLIQPPADVADARGFPLITEALLQRGFPEGVIRKILGGNALRLFDAFPGPGSRSRPAPAPALGPPAAD